MLSKGRAVFSVLGVVSDRGIGSHEILGWSSISWIGRQWFSTAFETNHSSRERQQSILCAPMISKRGVDVLQIHVVAMFHRPIHDPVDKTVGTTTCARWNRTTGPLSPYRFEACTHHQAGSCTHGIMPLRYRLTLDR